MSMQIFKKVNLQLKFSLRVLFYSSQPEQVSKPQSSKVVHAAIIGAPNSGKSTLINKMVQRKICAASNKVHTTTKLVRAMCFENDTQIVFLDTPGIVSGKEQKKYNLPESMIRACHKSLNCANVIGVVHDISNKWTRESLHQDVVTMLNLVPHVPSFLILNKVDIIKTKKQLLSMIWNLTNGRIAGNPVPAPTREKTRAPTKGYDKFSDVFIVSALKGDGVSDIKNYLMANAKPAKLHYSADKWTDQQPETLIVEAVRAKFLDFLSQEIPYSLKTILEYYEDKKDEDKIICHLAVECPTERLVRLISGAGGGRLQQIKSHVQTDLIDLFKKHVSIDIRLTCKNKSEDALSI